MAAAGRHVPGERERPARRRRAAAQTLRARCEGMGRRYLESGKRTRADGRVIHGAALSASRTAWASIAGARAVEDAQHGEREQVPRCRPRSVVAQARKAFESTQERMATRTTQIEEREEAEAEGEPGSP
jgi:hypothetical protein